MKKTAILFLATALILSAAGCTARPASSGTSSLSGSSAASQGSSQASSGPAASGTPSSQVPASSQEPAFQDVSRAPSTKAQAAKNDGNYKVKDESYTYKNENNDFSVSYPQLSGLAANQDKVNAALKTSAMKTVTSLGTGAKKEKTKVKTSGDVTFEGKTFLSVGFNEYVTPNPKADTTHTLRTANVDLKTGTALSFADLIKESDAFYTALQKAAQAQLGSKYTSKATASAIKSGLDKNSMYFTDSSVGFALKLSGDSKLLRVTLGFGEVKPFITSNAAWKNFI